MLVSLEQSLITVDNDAKSCFERIVKGTALLACMSIRLPQSTVAMHNKVHDNMIHSIETRHGLLRSYCGTDDGGSNGAGRGSGAARAIWLVYSNTLISALAPFSPGVNMVSPPIDTLESACLPSFLWTMAHQESMMPWKKKQYLSTQWSHKPNRQPSLGNDY